MDKIGIDFNSLLPHAIDAFTAVYGEEYYSIISKRINNAVIFSYHDVEGLSDYLLYIEECQRKKFSIKFLDQIGVDIQKYKKDNYTEPLDDEVLNILKHYIYSPHLGFGRNPDLFAPIRAFDLKNGNEPSILLENKIELINYLLGDEHVQITEENFESFAKTNEYLEILKKISELNHIYEKIRLEYNEWKIRLLPYEEYIDQENKRKKVILQKKKDELFEEIFTKLPLPVRISLLNKTVEEQQQAIFGSSDISSKFIIEYLKLEQIEKLRNTDIDTFEKWCIVSCQSNYLSNLGITVPKEFIPKYDSSDNINNYLDFLNQDNIKEYIPSEELISYISATKEKKYEEALREYYTTRKDFIEAIKMNGNHPNNIKIAYENIKSKQICITGSGAIKNGNEFVSVMFFTIGTHFGGMLSHAFMHELGHIIDQSQRGIGFESINDLEKKHRENPYNSAYRKYERFNETLNDIFTIEAVQYLENQGVYLIEPKEFTLSNRGNLNTQMITKNLLQPLIQKFRKQIIKAKVNADSKELTKYIGEENFEELVDTVNKVDNLVKNGLVDKINNSPRDVIVKEYLTQVERVKQIYINIDEYYMSHFVTLPTSSYAEGAKTK